MHPWSALPEFVEQIESAIAQATLNAMRRDADRQPGAPVGIHTLLGHDTGSELEARRSHQSWGFCLISIASDSPQIEPGSARPALELYLYPEDNARKK